MVPPLGMQKCDVILIAVKFMGIYWEIYSERNYDNLPPEEFFQKTRDRYRNKLSYKPFRMRLHYQDEKFLVTAGSVNLIDFDK